MRHLQSSRRSSQARRKEGHSSHISVVVLLGEAILSRTSSELAAQFDQQREAVLQHSGEVSSDLHSFPDSHSAEAFGSAS